MTDSVHILGNFEHALREARARVMRMASIAEQNLENAVRGLLTRNSELCNEGTVEEEEVNQLERRTDAESAARSVLNGQATAPAKSQTGSAEMIRHLKIARDSAVKSRSQAMVTLKTLIINAPEGLRDSLDRIRGRVALIRHAAALRPGDMTSPTASAKMAMRAIARRWLALHEEAQTLEQDLERLVRGKAPDLMDAQGISTMTVAEMLILVGDNPERIKSEAALAKPCGVCPIPACSGKTNRMRLNRGGNRQANAALYHVAIVRMRGHPPTRSYVAKRTIDGNGKREIIRCLKRYIVTEIYRHLCAPPRVPVTA